MTPYVKEASAAPITVLRGIGKAAAALYEKLDIRTLGDLLRHFPRTYEDRSQTAEIASLADGQTACVRAALISEPQHVRGKSRPFVRASASDDTGVMTLMFFNNPYITSRLTTGETYIFYGRAQRN